MIILLLFFDTTGLHRLALVGMGPRYKKYIVASRILPHFYLPFIKKISGHVESREVRYPVGGEPPPLFDVSDVVAAAEEAAAAPQPPPTTRTGEANSEDLIYSNLL